MNDLPISTAGGPLETVLEAARSGIPSVQGIVATTGLPHDVVEAAVEHLVRLGRVATLQLTEQCGPVGCGSCPLARGHARGCDPGR